MRIIQISTTVSYGDGVSNDIFALHNVIEKMGYETAIYVENMDSRIDNKHVKYISDIKNFEINDIILYHLSTGTPLNYKLHEYQGRKIVIYHNITPPSFFKKYNLKHFQACTDGLNGMKNLSRVAEYCLVDSEFNKRDLVDAGYKCQIDTLPILIPFEDYEKVPDKNIIDKYIQDGYVNFLFTGRIVPNKKQEDIIKVFYQYQRYYNAKSRLFLVGSYQGMENYYRRLQDYVSALGLREVYFTGHISFDKILAYYKIADVFICMSEHEGFCIPLIEAMYFGIPILAYDSTAISDTLGGSGVLTNTKNPLTNAAIINCILTDEELKENILENQKERLKDFRSEVIAKQFMRYVNTFMELKNEE